MLIPKDKFILLILAALFIFLVAIPRLLYPELDHGDEFSDASVLMSGSNFVKFGFIKCRFLPVAQPHLDAPRDPYTHAPPMSDITNGLLRRIFATDSLRLFRAAALAVSLLGLLFWYLFVKKFSGSRMLAFLAGLFYLTNPYFIYGADSLYQNAYADFLRVSIFYFFLCAMLHPARRKLSLLLAAALFALQTAYTFEYIAYMGLFFFFFRYFYTGENRLPLKYVSFLMLAPVLVVALHFIQNAWYFGSFHLAFQDLRNIAVERIASSKDSPLGALTFPRWWNYVLTRYISLAFLFNFYIVLSFSLFFFILYQNLSSRNKPAARRLFLLCLLLFFCGISWYILFPSHSLAHTFVLFLPRHLVCSASLSFTLIFYVAYYFTQKENPANLLAKIALAAGVIALSLTGIVQSELPVTKEKIARAKDFLVFKDCLSRIRQEGDDKSEVGLNYYRFPFIRYYTFRRCRQVFDKGGLEQLKPLPGYFILFPQDNPVNYALRSFLNEKYTVVAQCNSARFPAVVLKLKQ